MHPMLIKKLHEFFFKSFLPVMFLLPVDVTDDALNL